jgi:uncharacterized protein
VAEHVILFGGPMGAGKTTAIASLSEIDVVSTEAANTERDVVDKPTTTVALDYGEITLDAEEKVRLYGIPGQRRFDFMWTILKERARGMILLVNNDAPDPVTMAVEFLEEFGDLYERGGVVIGVSRTDIRSTPTLDDYSAALEAAHPEKTVPVFTVDPRQRDQMRTLLMSLIVNIEVRAGLAGLDTAPLGSEV